MSAGLRCRIGDCDQAVLATLSVQGVCVGHYLDLVFARLKVALALCHEGDPIEPGAFDWLLSQGDFAARALAEGGGVSEPAERTRLLELLLCLANLHEYAKHHSIEVTRTISARSTTVAR